MPNRVVVIGTPTVGVIAPEPLVVAALVTGAAGGLAYAASLRWPRLWSTRRQSVLSRRVELAAEEAVFDDPAFDPVAVKAAAAELHAGVIAAWSADDRRQLAELLTPELFRQWTRRLDELRRRGWKNPLRRRGRLRVRYVGLVNRTDEAEDRVVVYVRARMEDAIYDRRGRMVFRDADDSGRRTHCEYWTLGKRDGRWVLVSVETEQEGAHHLSAPIVSAPWADDRLRDDVALEQAAAVTMPPAALAGIVPLEFSGDLRTAALDLAGFDRRFDPDVLEAAARQAVAAWAEAIDGSRQALLAIAEHRTVDALLHPEADRRRRLVIRGPHLQELRIVALQPTNHPPSMTVEATISARRYLQSRATGTVLGGSRKHDSTFTAIWKMRLTDNPETPWRISAISTTPETSRSVLYRYTIGLAGELLDLLLNRSRL
jgi:predicted lipid-binding transport protein (Tim44 family)